MLCVIVIQPQHQKIENNIIIMKNYLVFDHSNKYIQCIVIL
jgi:hypothetical protein